MRGYREVFRKFGSGCKKKKIQLLYYFRRLPKVDSSEVRFIENKEVPKTSANLKTSEAAFSSCFLKFTGDFRTSDEKHPVPSRDLNVKPRSSQYWRVTLFR